MNNYETPPILKGTAEQQLNQIYGYLFRLSEALNVADDRIGTLSTPQIISEIRKNTVGIIPDAQTIEDVRALINKTAKELYNGLEGLESDFGAFETNIISTIEETAGEVINRYGITEAISGLQEQSAGFSTYIMETEGFIKQGFIDRNEQGVPIVGIAIGQGLTSQKVIIDGNEYEQIDSTQSCAFYTANRVSFRVNGREVAYVSNRKLYIGDVEITGGVVLDGKWLINTENGFSIEWIGGDE